MDGGLADFSVDDFEIDSHGRMILTNPKLARALKAVKRLERRKPSPLPNTNCYGCNTAWGCGATNADCVSKLR